MRTVLCAHETSTSSSHFRRTVSSRIVCSRAVQADLARFATTTKHVVPDAGFEREPTDQPSRSISSTSPRASPVSARAVRLALCADAWALAFRSAHRLRRRRGARGSESRQPRRRWPRGGRPGWWRPRRSAWRSHWRVHLCGAQSALPGLGAGTRKEARH
jgi:hypothetical protein